MLGDPKKWKPDGTQNLLKKAVAPNRALLPMMMNYKTATPNFKGLHPEGRSIMFFWNVEDLICYCYTAEECPLPVKDFKNMFSEEYVTLKKLVSCVLFPLVRMRLHFLIPSCGSERPPVKASRFLIKKKTQHFPPKCQSLLYFVPPYLNYKLWRIIVASS